MVVTPKQAIRLNVEKDQVRLERLEEKIDAEPREGFTGESLYINVEDVRPKVYDELRRRYTAAGWNVKLESDQREGTYFVFAEARR